MKKTLVGIFSHSAASAITCRHWPYLTICDAALWGIGREDKPEMFPEPIYRTTHIGQEGYAGGPNLCLRLVEAMRWFLIHPEFQDFTDLCLVEYDAVFLRPIPEHPGGLVTFKAGGGSEGFLSTRYFHTPWWVDRPTARLIVDVGRQLIGEGAIEQGFPDRFLGLICDRCPAIEVKQSQTFSVNLIDTDDKLVAAELAAAKGAWYVHGLKTFQQLKAFMHSLPDISKCPRCGYYVEDMDGFGCVAHIKPTHRMGCGYCSHPNVTDGKCGICGEAR